MVLLGTSSLRRAALIKLDPFADDSTSPEIGKLTIENRTDRVSLYSRLRLTCDQEGLSQARRSEAVLKAVVQALERTPELPRRVLPPEGIDEVADPFG